VTFTKINSTVYLSPSGGDDTSALQAAINSGNPVQLNCGTFLDSGTLTVASPTTFQGSGTCTIIQNSGLTNNVFNFTYATTAVPFALFRGFQIIQASGTTPTAGYGMRIGAASGYTQGLHIEDVHFVGLWGALDIEAGQITNWFSNLSIQANNSYSSVGIFHNSPVPNGDDWFENIEVQGTFTNAPVVIAQSDTVAYEGLKVNTGNTNGILFTQAGTAIRMRFVNPSIEGVNPSTGCGINFGTGSNPPTQIEITGGAIDIWQYALCNWQTNTVALAFDFDQADSIYTGHVTQTSALSGSGTATFTLGGSTIVGSGATAVCTTSHVCDSISGSVTIVTGSGVSTTGTALTVNLPVTRGSMPNCTIYSQNDNTGAPATLSAYTTVSSIVFTSTANLASTNGYHVSYVCGGR
jgi:hypothetical protein